MFVRPGLIAGLLSLFITAGSAMGTPVAPEQPSPALRRKIDADVKSALGRFGVPGAAVMVIQGGKVSLVQAFGTRDMARRLPIRPDTYFEIGSITKQFTAASILQLQESGRLQIDRPLADYLPDAPHAKEVTLRQLLTHTSGLHDYFDDQLAAQPISYKDLIARVESLPLDFTPEAGGPTRTRAICYWASHRSCFRRAVSGLSPASHLRSFTYEADVYNSGRGSTCEYGDRLSPCERQARTGADHRSELGQCRRITCYDVERFSEVGHGAA
jgi:hypothetical protein